MNKKFESLFVGFGIVCMIVGLVSLAQSMVPSGGPYYLQVPTSTWTYLVDQFSNGSYYMVNGTNWKVDYQSTNSTTVLRYALGNMTSGGLLHIRAGSYAAFGLNPLSNTIVEGEGRATKLIFPNGLYDDQGHLGHEDNNVFYIESSNVTIRYMEIDGNQSAYAKYEVAPAHNGNGIRFENCTYGEVYGCYIHDTRRSGVLARGYVYTYSPIYMTVHDSTFVNCNWDAIEFAGCADATAYNCFITGTSDVAIGVWEASRITLDNIVAWDGNRDMGSTDGHNIMSYDGGNETYCTSEVILTNSHFYNFDTGVLFLSGTHNCKLIHNTFVDISESAIWSNQQVAYDNTIEGNSFQNCANGSMAGVINIIGSSAVSKGWIIEGNHIDSVNNTATNDIGIYLVGSQYDQIKNNHISNLGGKGIVLDSCNNTQVIGNVLWNISWNVFKLQGSYNFNITIKDNQCYTTGGYMFQFENVPAERFDIENNWFKYPTNYFWSGAVRPNSTILAYNRGYRTEYSSSATNATATTFTFTPSMAGTPIRVYASFNSTEIDSWSWTFSGATLTITVTNSATTNNRTCYVEAYSWNYP